jgi:SPP1 family predicted phage head-tail adaptor
MRSGLLRQRVTLQRVSVGTDSQGGPTRTFATLVDRLPAMVVPLSGQEALAAAQQTSELRTKVTIRFRTDVSAEQRLVWGTRTLEIGSVQYPDGRRDVLELICTEVQA